MGLSASVFSAPTPVANGVRQPSEPSRQSRRFSSPLFRFQNNSGWRDSTVATSRGSMVEPRRPSLVVQEQPIAPAEPDPVPTPGHTDFDSRETRTAGPNESLFSASTRSLLGGRKRRMSRLNANAISELQKELQLVKRNIFSKKPWKDGVAVMWIVLSNTLTSVVVAWLVAAVYAVGSPVVSMLSIPRHRTRPLSRSASLFFSTAVGAYFVVFVSLSYAITTSCILADRLLAARMTARFAFRRAFVNYLRVAVYRTVLAILVGAAIMAALDIGCVDYIRIGRSQLLALVFLGGSYVDYAVRHARPVRRRIAESLGFGTPAAAPTDRNSSHASNAPAPVSVGAALDTSAANIPAPAISTLRRLSTMSIIPRAASSRTLIQKLMRGYRGFTVVCISVMFAYMHLAIALRMDAQWQISLFAAFSLTVKISIQEATKYFFLSSPRKPSARTTHMVMTLPTILIDAQIRMVFVQLTLDKSASSSSVFTSSFIIVVCKILFRLAKILRLRHTIKSRLSHSRGMHRILKRVNSKLAVRDGAVARAEYSQFLDCKNQKLRIHAAEVFADMHGEYISIGVAMAIVFYLTNHPMYTLGGTEGQIPRLLVSAAVQILTSLVFDFIASVVEGVHEVPLYEAIGDEGRNLRVFMHVLLGALTSINVGIVAVFLLSRPEAT